MAWTKQDYELAFGKGAWDGRFNNAFPNFTATTLRIEREQARERLMADYVKQANQLGLTMAKEEELSRHIKKNFDTIQRHLTMYGAYKYKFPDGSYVTLKKQGGIVTGDYQYRSTSKPRPSYVGSVPKTTGKKSAYPFPSNAMVVGGAFASLGTAVWTHVLKPLLMPLHEWLKVKEDGKETETDIQVRNDSTEPTVGSTEGTETAGQ